MSAPLFGQLTGSASPLGDATGVITIDLKQIARNWRALAERVHPAACAAVVKADAYGLGADRVIPTLVRAGCDTFFLATPQECERARRLAPKAALYALDGLAGAIGGGTVTSLFAELDIRPVLSTLNEILYYRVEANAQGRKLSAALHIDSGLNRLGLSATAVRRIAMEPQLLDGLDITLVMSHLACADNAADAKNRDQLRVFHELSELLPRTALSLAASDGLMLGRDYHFDLVRPGYALYGGQASATNPAPVAAAVRVAARILAVRSVAPGETVGYSATWRASRQSRIATVAAGYADGIPRSASSADGETGGSVLIAGLKAPIVGRVSMDLITVDVTDIPEHETRVGEFATLIGPGLTIEDAGNAAGTIGYEVLTRLGTRFARNYIEDMD